jgi:L-xylulokinase
MPVLLGLDIGNTVVKAILIDTEGNVVGLARTRCLVEHPEPGFVERDMSLLWQVTIATIRRCLHDAQRSASEIIAVGLSGHGDGVHLVDADLRPARRAILPMDTRASGVIDRWRGAGILDRALRLTGQQPFTGSPAAILAWLYEHEPDVLNQTRWVLAAKDWIRVQLTGRVGTDLTDASASFVAVGTHHYNSETFALFGLTSQAQKLPDIHTSTSIVGAVTAAAARDTGLPEAVPVVAGAHDTDTAAIGMGAASPGILSVVAGTFSVNQVVSREIHADPRWQVRPFAFGHFLNMSTSPASATNLDWFLERFGLSGEQAFAIASSDVEAVLNDRLKLIYHPFLHGSTFDTEAAGSFIGLRAWHSRAHMLRAVFEGVVYNHRTHISALREGFSVAPRARLAGGASRSAVWSQIFADALDLIFDVPETADASAYGAALIAGIGTGLWKDTPEAIDTTVRVARTHYPDDARVQRFNKTYDAYVQVTYALRKIWPTLG